MVFPPWLLGGGKKINENYFFCRTFKICTDKHTQNLEVYYLHEVCHSCTNLIHGIVPEVYYLHEVCHSCTNLVHGIVPEVYYLLHEVCHSCTILVHGTVPEVYYLHEVCHSCTNLIHGIVLQDQWIWAILDVCMRKVSKRSSAVWETNTQNVRELCLPRTP